MPLLDHFMKMYADILYRWHLLDKRAEVLKFLSQASEPHKGVGMSVEGLLSVLFPSYSEFSLPSFLEFSTRCHHCHEKLRGAQCWSCKGYGLQCSVCHVAVKGKSEGKFLLTRFSAYIPVFQNVY